MKRTFLIFSLFTLLVFEAFAQRDSTGFSISVNGGLGLPVGDYSSMSIGSDVEYAKPGPSIFLFFSKPEKRTICQLIASLSYTSNSIDSKAYFANGNHYPTYESTTGSAGHCNSFEGMFGVKAVFSKQHKNEISLCLLAGLAECIYPYFSYSTTYPVGNFLVTDSHYVSTAHTLTFATYIGPEIRSLLTNKLFLSFDCGISFAGGKARASDKVTDSYGNVSYQSTDTGVTISLINLTAGIGYKF